MRLRCVDHRTGAFSVLSPAANVERADLDLDWITPQLAVGGAFAFGAVPLLRQLGVRAVVDLRSEARDDEALLADYGVAFLHLPTDDHHAVSPPMLDEGAAFARRHMDRGERLLIHCREGIGRSVTLALCVLAELGFAPLAAMSQIKDRRYYASPSPAQFEAWAQWLRARGTSAPSFEDFAAIAYRHLAR